VAASNTKSKRTKRDIEADLESRRSRLTTSIEDVVDQVHPKRVKQRTVAEAKQAVDAQVESAKSLVFNARGDLRTERLATAGGVVGGVIALLVTLRILIRRRRRASLNGD